MGEASKAQFEMSAVTCRRSKSSTVLDTKRLLADHPELLTQYRLTRSNSRRSLVQGADHVHLFLMKGIRQARLKWMDWLYMLLLYLRTNL